MMTLFGNFVIAKSSASTNAPIIMPDDNPYAAPQTIDRAVPWADALPMALGSERRLYPDVSTTELSRLANWSMAIDGMSLVWGVVISFAGLAFVVNLWMYPLQWFWGLVLGLTAMRLWGDYRRTSGYWAYNLLLDLLFLGGFLFAILGLARVDLLALLIVGIPMLAFGLIAAMSVLAHLLAKPLYGQYTHRELIREVRYRKQNRIP